MIRQLVVRKARVGAVVLSAAMVVAFGTEVQASATSPAPAVSNAHVVAITSGSVYLEGDVNANGATTTAWFQYGTSTNMQQTVHQNIGAEQTDIPVAATISSLTPGTTYYFSLVASNANGTSVSPTGTFVSPPLGSGGVTTTTGSSGSTPVGVLSNMKVTVGLRDAALNSVACPTATRCWAVGSAGARSNVAHSVIEELKGTSWVRVNAPNVTGSELLGVACSSARSCWSVGSVGLERPLILHFNGRNWTSARVPSVPGTTGDSLNAVTCVSGSDCWAVGITNGGTAQGAPLAERWNGVSWKIVATPNPGDSSYLSSVSCISAKSCWAVGIARGFSSLAGQMPLFLHFNGARWIRAVAPRGVNYVTSVDCHFVSACFAVGWRNGSRSVGAGARVFRLRANRWNPVSVAGTSALTPPFVAVHCATPLSCWLVGGGAYIGLNSVAEHWDGSRWSDVTFQSVPGLVSTLNAINCAGAHTCYAVGFSAPKAKGGSTNQSALIELTPASL